VPQQYEIVPSCQVPASVLQGIYLEQFGYRETGLFVEVGAWDGVQFSNTWGLAHAGWHGLYIEANPESIEACRRNHAGHSVEIETCAIGNGNGECDLFLGGSVSTLMENHARAWGIPLTKHVRVPMRTLDFVLEKHNWPVRYDLLVVDVEGAEEAALRGYSIHRWRPRVAIIETHEGGGLAEPPSRIVEFCAGYFWTFRFRNVWHDAVNTIYVSNDPVI